jgi:hypothetical protein
MRSGPPSQSLGEYAAGRLRALCLVAGFGGAADRAARTFRDLISPWGDEARGRPMTWRSEISDDNTPIEFSVAIADRGIEVRALFEAQGEEPTLPSYRAAGMALTEKIEREYGADLSRLRQLEDLFLPQKMRGPFAVWHSAVFSRTQGPSFKAYLSPQAQGPAPAEGLVREGLERLGLGHAWPSLARSVLRRGPVLDELKYFALDLTSDAHARVKIYVRHHEATPEDVEAAASAAATYVPGEALDFARAMRGGDDRLAVRAPFSCSSFVGGTEGRPASTTVYVPVCAYARDDQVVQNRVLSYMLGRRVDPAPYVALLHGFATRPLDSGVGMQSWMAFRRYAGEARLTLYLASEANRVYPPGEVPAPTEVPRPFAAESGAR